MLAIALLLAQPRPPSLGVALRKELAGLKGVQFEEKDGDLTVRYRTKEVSTPAVSKSRTPRKAVVIDRPIKNGFRLGKVQVPLKMMTVERPAPTGFKLETYAFFHKGIESLRMFQAVPGVHDMGAWKFEAGDVQIPKSMFARYYHIEWGKKIDPALLAKLQRILGAPKLN